MRDTFDGLLLNPVNFFISHTPSSFSEQWQVVLMISLYNLSPQGGRC